MIPGTTISPARSFSSTLRRFADRFVLSAGHTVPLVYGSLAVLNEALRIKHERTGDERYAREWIAQMRDWVEDQPRPRYGVSRGTS